MADALKPGARLFVDTGFFLALDLPRDTRNSAARKWAKRSKRNKYKHKQVTTHAALFVLTNFAVTSQIAERGSAKWTRAEAFRVFPAL